MKRTVLSIVLAAVLCGGCDPEPAIVPVHRTVTLYNANGGVIKAWHNIRYVHPGEAAYSFFVDGRWVTISGTFTIEQE